ncbi:MAG: site-specific DNA-methyltransferase, partial [Mucilaginibacter sp.]
MNKQDLIQKLKQLDGLTVDEKAALIELVKTKKKYGLVWEDKPEAVEDQLRQYLPVLKEVTEKRILAKNITQPENAASKLFKEENTLNHAAPNHILVEGDNLHALTALSFTHEGQIDLIYIDPPYNTGNKDFKYNDTFVDKEDTFRHSKWLSFMEKRLKIAKTLLSEKGTIFISIDDNELAQLKMLCDEVFNEDNFIEYFSWTKTSTPPGLSKKSRKTVEYILCYEKQKNSLKYQGDLIDGGDAPLLNTGNNKRDLIFPKDKIQFRITDGFYKAGAYEKVILKNDLVIKNGAADQDITLNGEFKWTQATTDKEIENGTYFIVKSDKFSIRFQRADIDSFKSPTNQIKDNITSPTINKNEQGVETNEQATSEILNILGVPFFDYPKPVSLIKYFIGFFQNKDLKILDFFAGSGTTLHATMLLNSEDNGNRQCILVTNNENKICEEVTYERNKRIIEGYTSSKGDRIKGLFNNNLRYYRSEFVSSTKNEINKRLLTQASTELLQIKENCYTDITEANGFDLNQCGIFTNDLGKYMIAVYHSRNQPAVCEELISYVSNLQTEQRVKLYAFSPEKETLAADFAEVADKIEALPLPDAIYNAYR